MRAIDCTDSEARSDLCPVSIRAALGAPSATGLAYLTMVARVDESVRGDRRGRARRRGQWVRAVLVLFAACSGGSSSPRDAARDAPAADAPGSGNADGGARDGVDAGAEAARDGATGTDAPLADGGVDAPPADGGVDAPPADGGISCGSASCAGDDLCVTVSTCGGAVICTDLPDGGCPTGTTQTQCPTGRPGCTPNCPAPTSSCKPRPAACGATISCLCITPDTCGGPSCASASGRNVFCANQ